MPSSQLSTAVGLLKRGLDRMNDYSYGLEPHEPTQPSSNYAQTLEACVQRGDGKREARMRRQTRERVVTLAARLDQAQSGRWASSIDSQFLPARILHQHHCIPNQLYCCTVHVRPD